MKKKVIAKVVKIEGKAGAVCSFGHKVGDSFEYDEFGFRPKMCVYAQTALMPAVNIMLSGGKFG